MGSGAASPEQVDRPSASRVRIALRHKYKIGKGTGFADTLRRVRSAFADAGLQAPLVLFSMGEGRANKVSAVDRVLRRFPELKSLDHMVDPGTRQSPYRQLGNECFSPRRGEPVDFATLLEIAAGVPRSFPFFDVSIRLTHADFGAESPEPTSQLTWPGVMVTDSWGNGGRSLSVVATVIVEAERDAHCLPAFPNTISLALQGCGETGAVEQHLIVAPGTRTVAAILELSQNSQAGMAEIVERAKMPHDFVDDDDRPTLRSTGPRKPALLKAMAPLGYDCRAGGMFVLTCSRRTSSNLLVRLYCDFGSSGNHANGTYSVVGLGFRASLKLPVSARSSRIGLNWIVDNERWQHIAENWAALVGELDRSFLPMVEAAAGPSPAWFRTGGAFG